MLYSKKMMVAALGMLCTQLALATPTAEEAAELGKSLTPMGAIKAGNKEGTIPEWTGGLCTPPAGYAPKNGAKGGTPYVDPFADDKPLFKINAQNMAQYADKLDEGTQELLRRYPDTFYVQVYPTHRSACFPNWLYENNIKNVMRPKIVGSDIPSLDGAHAQTPFPIPKNGVEAVWNGLVPYRPLESYNNYLNYYVDSSGRGTVIDDKIVYEKNPYWDNSVDMIPDEKPYNLQLSRAVYPPAAVGTMTLGWTYRRPDLRGDPVWSYIPGQRRVRLAPEFAYDGVPPNAGGTFLFDEGGGFKGKMNKFDFKLLGRKEMYIPYNSNTEALSAGPEVNLANHIDPAVMRWELHRVWVVEATLKPGERHVQQRKMMHYDEDSWKIAIYQGIDHSGKVHHHDYFMLRQSYEKPGLEFANFITMDFSKRAYSHWMFTGKQGVSEKFGTLMEKDIADNWFTPQGMTAMGVR